MQNTLGGMNPWFYQSVMTVETVGLFKTAERNPENRPECETHLPRPKKSSDNSPPETFIILLKVGKCPYFRTKETRDRKLAEARYEYCIVCIYVEINYI